MKKSLLETISIQLLREGYTIKNLNSCFDIIARKNTNILLLKIINDANSLYKESIEEMKKISSYINASPLIIAEKSSFLLEDNVVYSRYGINTLNPKTFFNILNKKLPFIKSDKGGIKIRIIGNKLKEKREQQDLSLNSLARKLGVSTRMISKYEQEISEISLKKALKLYELLGDVFKPVDLFSKGEIIETHFSDISRKYHNLGFESLETTKSPFDIIAKREKEIILTNIGDNFEKDILSLAKLIDSENLVIFERKKPRDIPSIKKEEFLEFEKAQELIKFLKEFI